MSNLRPMRPQLRPRQRVLPRYHMRLYGGRPDMRGVMLPERRPVHMPLEWVLFFARAEKTLAFRKPFPGPARR